MITVTYKLPDGTTATVAGRQVEVVRHNRLKVPAIVVMGLTKKYIPIDDVVTIIAS